LYKWVKAVKPDRSEEQAAALIEARSEVLKLRAQLKEERDILKKAARYFAQEPE
jgi:transposase